MKRFLCLPALFLAFSLVHAEVASGPKPGDKLEDFKVFGVVGSVDNKQGSYVADRKEEPVVYVFVQHEHWGRPMAKFLKTLDKDVKETNDKAFVGVIWLSEMPDKVKDYLPKAQMSLNFANTSLGVFEGDKSGPNNWGINVDAHCTVVVGHKGKAVKVLALQSVNETDVKKVVDAIKAIK